MHTQLLMDVLFGATSPNAFLRLGYRDKVGAADWGKGEITSLEFQAEET
jgi:hypothetical protein